MHHRSYLLFIMSIEIKVTRVHDKASVSVARPTALGNPFVMHTEADRDAVCDAYSVWFNEMVYRKDPAVMDQLRQLYRLGKTQGYLKLGCHCAPKRCHADTIARFLQQYF